MDNENFTIDIEVTKITLAIKKNEFDDDIRNLLNFALNDL